MLIFGLQFPKNSLLFCKMCRKGLSSWSSDLVYSNSLKLTENAMHSEIFNIINMVKIPHLHNPNSRIVGTLFEVE